MNQRRALQIVVAAASLVPICGGAAGIVLGPAMIGSELPVGADSHFRFLSGLLFGIGIGFVTTVPRIERHSARFRLLAAIIVIGGLGRLWSLIAHGAAPGPAVAALVMELGVTPALALWQARVARASGHGIGG